MKVTKDGNVYKVARITGPKHNFLGLTLSGAEVPSLTVERLQVDDGSVLARSMSHSSSKRFGMSLRKRIRSLGHISILQSCSMW
jgi:hypothetical protein